ncbi:putative Recombinase [Magnetospirillum sp. XM-1]|uniref:recombinase family protein n=1 Tax=Magnetospirillum sp. XM-1 TaxID=1663591 RepID=UPI00073DD951|nr:putative Recombinase [Magnetospirillum sp. XM-1]
MKCVIYARYSSDNQREASINDQLASCRAYAARLGWIVVDTYSDSEVTGRTAFRSEYQRLLGDAARHRFDVLLAESIDRISRRLADLADMYDTLSADGIKMHTVQTGEISDLHISMLGLVAQQFSKDLGHKTKRGQAGRIDQGKLAGGIAYGYRALPPIKTGKTTEAGDREIIEQEADVVRRIFTLYAAGHTPEVIVATLNSEGVPGPGGRLWRNTTIRGQGKRGTGILRNELYIGRLVWNRCRFIRLPKTGKRVAKINDPADIKTAEVPHLRIIDQDLWEIVQARLVAIGHKAKAHSKSDTIPDLNATHRPRYLLAHLLKCSCCGGNYIILGKDRYGCANHRRGTGMCTNGKTITRQKVEDRVLACLKHKLLEPDRVEAYVAEVQRQLASARKNAAKTQSQLAKRLADAKAAIKGMVDMVESGKAPKSILDRLIEREREQAQIEAEMAAQPADDGVITMMPNLAQVYARKVAELADALNDPEIKIEATELIRQLITKVEMIPDPDAPDGMRMDVHGVLAELLALAAGRSSKSKLPGLLGPGSQLSVVAGAGFEPATFRL